MEDARPGFRQFAKLQNDPRYQLTGIITDSETGLRYVERNFARTKCVFDFLLLAVSLTVIFCAAWLAKPLSAPLYDWFETAGYGSHSFWIPLLLSWLALGYGLAFFWIVLPLLIKLARRAFSLRWRFVSFEIDSPQAAPAGYLEYYNNITIFLSDTILWKIAKRSAELDRYYEERDIRFSRGWMTTLTGWSMLICVIAGFWLCFNPTALPVLYGSLVLLYGLSHAAAWYNWKRDFLSEAD